MKMASWFVGLVVALSAAGVVAGYCGLFVGAALYSGPSEAVDITFSILGIVAGYLLSSFIIQLIAKSRYFYEGSITLGFMGSLIGSFAIVFILRIPGFELGFNVLTLVLVLVPPLLTAIGYNARRGTVNTKFSTGKFK